MSRMSHEEWARSIELRLTELHNRKLREDQRAAWWLMKANETETQISKLRHRLATIPGHEVRGEEE